MTAMEVRLNQLADIIEGLEKQTYLTWDQEKELLEIARQYKALYESALTMIVDQ